MDSDLLNRSNEGEDCKHWRGYSRARQIVNNLPYIAMSVLGTAILIVGLQNSTKGWLAAAIYMAYAAAGALWVMIFICPYCHYWDTMSCPCGYGRIAAKLREKKDGDRFREKFRKREVVGAKGGQVDQAVEDRHQPDGHHDDRNDRLADQPAQKHPLHTH